MIVFMCGNLLNVRWKENEAKVSFTKKDLEDGKIEPVEVMMGKEDEEID